MLAGDGNVVVVPRAEAERVLAQSRAREANEVDKRARLARGELGLDIYNMRERLAARGLRFVNQRDEGGA